MSVQPPETVNAELFTLTYGAIVSQIVTDAEDVEEANRQLELMGYNIGTRLIDDFFAKTMRGKCRSFKETMEVVVRDGMRRYLGVVGELMNWNGDYTECIIVVKENPLAGFVELPSSLEGLKYSNIIPGVIRGCLEMIQLRVNCSYVRDAPSGDSQDEILVKLLEKIKEKTAEEYKEE